FAGEGAQKFSSPSPGRWRRKSNQSPSVTAMTKLTLTAMREPGVRPQLDQRRQSSSTFPLPRPDYATAKPARTLAALPFTTSPDNPLHALPPPRLAGPRHRLPRRAALAARHHGQHGVSGDH